ncbi:thiazole tautomerase (transcriptional regulator TenI) [Bacillus ectoiniformans]|nr:thiazole tautomerase (transcriptional regulator TenI) [Bacillus ectoiniformans]
MRPTIHLITAGTHTFTELTTIVMSVQEQIDFFHIREKNRTAIELYKGVQEIIDAGFPVERIIINDRGDVAAALGTFGVQLAHHSLPASVVKKTFPGLSAGKSVHSLEEAKLAEQEGVDYLLFGHLYLTSSKPGKVGRGLRSLREITRTVRCPVLGIGGITPDRAKDVIFSGAQGIAVMSGILQADEPVKAAKAYRKSVEEGYYEQAL